MARFSVINSEPRGYYGGRSEKWSVAECPQGSKHGTGLCCLCWSTSHLPRGFLVHRTSLEHLSLLTNKNHEHEKCNIVIVSLMNQMGRSVSISACHHSIQNLRSSRFVFKHVRMIVRKRKNCDILPTTVKSTTISRTTAIPGWQPSRKPTLTRIISVWRVVFLEVRLQLHVNQVWDWSCIQNATSWCRLSYTKKSSKLMKQLREDEHVYVKLLYLWFRISARHREQTGDITARKRHEVTADGTKIHKFYSPSKKCRKMRDTGHITHRGNSEMYTTRKCCF
jgi:hypothetical protein